MSSTTRRTRTLRPSLPMIAMSACAGLLLASAHAGMSASPSDAGTPAKVTAAATTAQRGVPLPNCPKPKKAATKKRRGDPAARAAAQRGLNFLATQTTRWQKQHKCFGCHVQAVTMEAFAVGRHHQYTIKKESYQDVIRGLTTIPGGARSKQGFDYAHGHTLQNPSKGFGGAALARHDQLVDQTLSDDLLVTAQQLLKLQQKDGSITLSWVNAPVGVGTIQGVYQAIQTWKQAYARSADDRWLTAVQKSEGYLQQVIDEWHTKPPANVQEVNYAILGLLAAGVGAEERSILGLQKMLLASQRDDGGWDFSIKGTLSGAKTNKKPAKKLAKTPARTPAKMKPEDVALNKKRGMVMQRRNFRPAPVVRGRGGSVVRERASVSQMKWARGKSSPFSTGQTLYTLRMLGMNDDDPAISRGTKWLVKNQSKEGGWSSGGFGKAEAMWGVLGLVSLDVLSLTVKGVTQGQHVGEKHPLQVRAWDNSGASVTHLEIAVDDLRVKASCGAKLDWTWDASTLAKGKHIIDVKATNSRGEVSKRRLEVFAGDIYLTQIGSTFTDGGTLVSLRNIAPSKLKNKVTMEVFSTKEVKGKRVAQKKVRAITQDGEQGAMSFFWDGKDGKGKAVKRGEKYLAKLTFLDAKGKARHTTETLFVHASYREQRARYNQVWGSLQFKGGQGAQAASANTVVELVDEKGNVVERTRSTANGQYRFRNVDKKRKYRIRVKKKGYKAKEQAVDFEAADAPAARKADFALE